MTAFLTKALAFLMSLFLTLVPYAGLSQPNFAAKDAEAEKLNVAMISDVHVDPYFPIRTTFLKTALNNLSRAKTKVDVMLNSGDVTNYADTESLIEYYDTIADYASFPVITAAGNHDIGHAGDRNVVDYDRETAKENFIYYHNLYTGDNATTTYFSQTVKGYKFIVIGDEVIDGGHWDGLTMSETQIEWLDSELDSANGAPVFVISHWPGDSTSGEDIIWDGSGVEYEENPIREILESHKNVIFVSGHMHGGIRCTVVGDLFNMPMAEKINGVTYVNLPSFGLVNQYGITWSGTGANLELYADKFIVRPVNYLTGIWYTNSNYTFTLD